MATPIRAEKLKLADRRAIEEELERTQDVRGMPQKELPLAGGRKGLLGMTQMSKGKATKSPMEAPSFNPAEIEGHGRSLADHIEKLHGGAYRTAFMRGMGGAYGNPDVADTPVAFSNTATKKMKGGSRCGRMVGAGPLKIEIEHSKEEEMAGGMQTGRYEGEGKVDKRKARGALLKKVMADNGLSMAAASKHIKDHKMAY
jgi:hypothetical protein